MFTIRFYKKNNFIKYFFFSNQQLKKGGKIAHLILFEKTKNNLFSCIKLVVLYFKGLKIRPIFYFNSL